MKKKNLKNLSLTRRVMAQLNESQILGGGSQNPTDCCIDPGFSSSCAPSYCVSCEDPTDCCQTTAC